jgi:hypothetical protein
VCTVAAAAAATLLVLVVVVTSTATVVSSSLSSPSPAYIMSTYSKYHIEHKRMSIVSHSNASLHACVS